MRAAFVASALCLSLLLLAAQAGGAPNAGDACCRDARGYSGGE